MPVVPPVRVAAPLLVTTDPDLLDDLLRLAAAAGVEPEVAPDVGAARRAWSTAPLVLVGADAVGGVRRRGLARREHVVLVTSSVRDESGVWEDAVAIGAREVLGLPGDESALVERLADAAESAGRPARLIGVLGGRGGAGASTLAAALAVTAARAGSPSLLIDADPLGGGLDLLLGGEDLPGLRWPALAGTRGRIGAKALRDALPVVDGLAVLSFDRSAGGPVPAAAVEAVLAAARRGGGVVIVDLPRHLDEAAMTALAVVDRTLLVVPADVRAAAAAAQVAAAAASVAADLAVVVREPASAGLSPSTVAAHLALPLAGQLRTDSGVSAAAERGEPPARSGRGSLAQLCRRLLDEGRRSRAA